MGVLSEIQKDLNLEVVALFGDCHDALLSEARALCNDDSGAEDLVMRTFEAYCKSRDNFDPGKGSWLSWLRGIMRNLHHNSSRGKAVGCMVYMTPEELAQIQDREVGSGEADDAVLRNSDAEVVRNAIGGLSPDMREVIVLRYFEDLPISRIAQILGASENSVKCRLYYARKILAKRLGGKLGKKSLALLLAAILGVGTLFGAWFSPLGDWVVEKVFGSAPAEAAEVVQAEPVQAVEPTPDIDLAAGGEGPNDQNRPDDVISETQKQESEDNMNISAKVKKAVAKTVATAAVAAMAVGLPANAEAGAAPVGHLTTRVTLNSFSWYIYCDALGDGATSCSWGLRYGRKEDFSDSQSLSSGTGWTAIREISESTVSKLQEGETFYLLFALTNNLNEVYEERQTVTTLQKGPPVVTKIEVTDIGFSSAKFKSTYTVGTGAGTCTAVYEYGTDATFADCLCVTQFVQVGATTATRLMEGLLPGTTYYVRLRLLSNLGFETVSDAVSFTTATEGAVLPTVMTNGIYEIFVYEKSGWYESAEDETIDYLVVGGGGAGGGYIGGGGGGGGVIHVVQTNLPAGRYPVCVGSGGIGSSTGNAGTSTDGGNSRFGASLAFGGGRGGLWNDGHGYAGGSGGGGSHNTAGGDGVPGQGFAGGSLLLKGNVTVNGHTANYEGLESGGGGATEPGGIPEKILDDDGNPTGLWRCGKGGDGYDCDITGVTHCYGSGGGGGIEHAKDGVGGEGGKESGGHGSDCVASQAAALLAGVDGLGGGGGGGSYQAGNTRGGDGGDGTVIIKRVWLKESPEPTLTKGVEVKDLTRSGVTLSLFVDMLGQGATSATVKLFVAPVEGEYPSVPSASKQITAAGETVEMALTGTSKATYKAYFVVENDRGKSTTTDPVEFTLLGLKIKATGGDIVKEVGDYKIHIFTNANETATFEVTTGGPADILIVGGGGGGGGYGGGGGGGGVIFRTNVAITVGSYEVKVGAGGAPYSAHNKPGSNGGDSALLGLVAFGGGGGGTWEDGTHLYVGMSGGSGGGGSNGKSGGAGVDGQGTVGGNGQGYLNGGGGGATQQGGALGFASTKGGDGLDSDITGEMHCYGSGGGGGIHAGDKATSGGVGGKESGGSGGGADNGRNGTAGVDTLGGGGGGAGGWTTAGKGGSGVVVIRYKIRNIVPGFAIIVK